jgi:ribosomal protein S18 acetylase RimI-like enzyme
MTANDPVLIRRAERRDLPVLGSLGAALVRDHHAFDSFRFLTPGPRLKEGYAQFLGTQLAQQDVAVFVAERAGSIVGYVYAGVEPRSWQELRDVAGFIHDVVVIREARGIGVGTRLIETAAAWLATRDVPRVILWTAEKNRAAQRLFEQLGFRRTMVEMTREATPPAAGPDASDQAQRPEPKTRE